MLITLVVIIVALISTDVARAREGPRGQEERPGNS